MKSNTYTLLSTEPPATSEAAIAWTMQLSVTGDAISGDEIESVIKLGDVVQAGALLALATPPQMFIGLPELKPADAEVWLMTSGEQADAASLAGGLAMITTGEAVPILARLLSMECTPELAAKIQAKMG